MSSKSMNAIARGGVVFAFGALGGQALQLVSGLIVIRYIAKGEYGLIALGHVAISLVITIALVGFDRGLPRFLARSRERGALRAELGAILGSAGLVALTSAVVWGALCYLFADEFATLLQKPDLAFVLRAFALLIPGLVLVQFLTACFQGIQRALPRAIFQEGAVKGLRLVLVLAAIGLGLGFEGVVYAYVGSVLLALLAYAAYAGRHLLAGARLSVRRDQVVALLLFSTPLVGVALTMQTVEWTGTMLLGLSQPAEEIARFNAPARLTALILLPLTALGFVYSPVAARLAEARDFRQLDRFYRTTTKWAVIATMPLVAFFVADAEYVVTLLFGAVYRDAAPVLVVVSLAYGLHVLFGPNMATLISCGDTRTVLRGTLASAALAIGLSLMLIPRYGAVGAALGTMSSVIGMNLIMSGILIRRFAIHALHWGVLVPATAAFLLATAIAWIFDPTKLAPVAHAGIFAALYVVTLAAPLLTRTLEGADLELLAAIERRTGLGAAVNRRIHRWMKVSPGPELR